jgi:hypothetical protein
MATVYKIHPAIGIARIGNSPTDFFIGPEKIGEYPNPPGGFKDSQCRVKRQAARFRIYAHYDNETFKEITSADADITWTVHLANKKAAYPNRGNSESAADLTIDPGPRTLTGPNQAKSFDNGQINFNNGSATVPLGEIRSDNENRLLVLGGFGHSASPHGDALSGYFWATPGWYDDISDGPVTATIKLHSDGSTPPVVGAWVIAPPPKFAPQIDNVITLYDRLLQAMIEGGLATAPNTTSYTADVYPILQRARTTQWVKSVYGAHGWADPVIADADRHEIFDRINPPGDMPMLNNSSADGKLTPTQRAHMQRWNDGNFTNDWSGPPAPQASITPDGLDRAALEACVGGAFFPGIEAGGLDDANRPILVAAHYSEPFRLNHALVSPGDITASMALPWQADFYACGSNWWPVPRPNDVIPQGTSSAVNWTRTLGSGTDMVNDWSKLGFIVHQGNQYVEVERCDTASITLLTPHLNFVDVPQGPMGMVRDVPLAIAFEVIAPGGPVTLSYASGGAPNHPQLTAVNTSDTVGPTAAGSIATARLWVVFSTGVVGAIPQQTVTVQEPVSGQQWDITIDANTVARKTTATALVLDRSGSMSEDRGDGVSKHVSLQQAANIFVDVAVDGDGIGLVSFSDDATALQQVLQLGNGSLSDINRGNTKDTINGNGLDPAGNTSIGDGIATGRTILNSAAVPYDQKAMVVLTDGVENTPLFIADVAADIDSQTYAVGLGMPQNISTAALQTISGNNGGYLLITGAIGTDNRFLLQKYFLQILAGITNAEIVLDPDGQLVSGVVQKIPFQLTEADSGVDVILLTPNTKIVDFRLQTPNGIIIEPWRALAEPSMRFVLSNGVSYYRVVLPTQLIPGRFDQGGTWNALLTIGKPHLAPTKGTFDGSDWSILRGLNTTGALRRRILQENTLRQSALQPGVVADRRALLAVQAAAAANTASTGGVSAASRAPAATSERVVPYSLIVHSYSNLSFRAYAEQSSYDPGAEIKLNAALTESGLPIKAAAVWAELKRPDSGTATVGFTLGTDGLYRGSYATAGPGIYKFRVRATGNTRKGLAFSREQTVTAPVWRKGEGQPSNGATLSGLPGGIDPLLCGLLQCLFAEGGVISAELEKKLHEQGIDLNRLRECLKRYCSGK